MSTEPAEDPVGHATSKVMQYTSFATMAAEVLQQRAAHRQQIAAAAAQRGAAARRAETTGARNAARLQWRPVLDPRRGDLSLVDAGLVWAASQPWCGVDAEADLASERAAARLRELRPDVMTRFDRLTGEGLDPVQAMLRVAPFFDQPAARPHGAGTRTALTHLDDDPQARVASTAQAGTEPAHHLRAHAARPGQDRVVLVASNRSQPELAADGYPEPLTAAVLAAGKVKAKDPARTAPAAVRSNSLATAARAAKGGRGQ